MKKRNKMLISFLIVSFIMFLFMPSKLVLAAEINKKNVYCSLCKYKESDGLMYKKERQFYDKVSALKAAYGDSIDEVALAASVLHRYGIENAYNSVYDINYKRSTYEEMAKSLRAGSESSSTLTPMQLALIQANEKIDLLTLAAIVMDDSSHHGKYSDVCFKQGLAGNRLVGNDEDENSSWKISLKNSFLNAAVCQKTKLEGADNHFDDDYEVSKASEEIRLKNIDKVCKNGFVGGLYNGVSKITDDSKKKITKEVYAQQIIDLANYYKRLYGSLEEDSCSFSTNIAGTTGDFATWKQNDSRWGNLSLGGKNSMANVGCLITSISMQIARSNTKIGTLPNGYNEFNPGAFVTSLSQSGTAFPEKNSANFYWTGFSEIAPNWHIGNNGYESEQHITDNSTLANKISEELSTPYDGKYQKFIVLWISATGHSQHWVAVNGVENGKVTIYDPGSYANGNTLDDNYSNWAVHNYKVMYATDVEFGQTGISSNNNTCMSNSGTGTGDIIIPEQYGGGGYTITNIDEWNWAYDSGEVYRKWLAAGSQTIDGVAVLDGRYLIACTTKFGKVGDKIDFFLDDGTRIPTIMMDTKSSAEPDVNEWGHSYGANVLEFEVLSNYYYNVYHKSNPGTNGWHMEWAGKRVASATNIDRSGTTSSGISGTTSNISVSDSYEIVRNGDLIAKLAVAVAPTASPEERIAVSSYKTQSSDSRAQNYNEIFYETIAKYPSNGAGNPNSRGDGYNNPAYASCAQAAAAIIRATVDPDISSGNPTSMEQYLKRNPEKWTKVGEVKAGEKFTDKCEPGDLLLTVNNSGDSGHAMIYVGKYAKNRFSNTGGVVWEAANDMSSRFLYPGITDKETWGSTMAIWRPTGKGNFYYPFIDLSKYIDVSFDNNGAKKCVNGQAVGGNNGVGSTVMNYSNAVEIPDYLWKNHVRWDTDPSIVVVDDSGNVLAQRKPNVRREGASTTKVFSGYAALKLLDVNNDVVTTTQFICSNTDNNKGVAVGTKTSIVDVATRDFPGSDNARADSIPLAIGYKYYSGSSDKDAYTVGLEKMNNLYRQIGCTNTNIGSGSGVISFNDSGWRSQDIYGIQTYSDGTGHTANDLALVTIEAMKDENFAGYFSNRNNEGLFYIKSGTGHCGHCIWGFNHNGKRYYISILGMNCNWSQGSENVKHTSKERTVKDIYNWVITDLIK